MTKQEKIRKKYNSFLYNHLWLKYSLDYGTTFLMSILSALLFSFGVVCFMKPGIEGLPDFVSGGSSGLAQIISLIFELSGLTTKSSNLVFSVAYVCINAPLIILAFKGIGKKFATFTMINVLSVSIFTNLFTHPFFSNISTYISMNGGMLARALFAGLCTGLSSALAFKFETSAGGFDILSYYISLRKSKSTGQYIVATNGVIITSFYIISGCSGVSTIINGQTIDSWTMSIGGILFSVIYLVECMIIIDLINVRNKKVQIQIVTSNPELPRLLLANIPHGSTIVKGVGSYSGQEKTIIYLVVSNGELRSTLRYIKELDPNSFVNVTSLMQVYGRFYIKPIK